MNCRFKKNQKLLTKVRNFFYPIENTIIIVLSYFLSALNFLGAGFYYSRKVYEGISGNFIWIGCSLFVVALISIFDCRKEMRGRLATISAIIIHFVFCMGFAIIYSYKWLALYLGEVIIGVGVIIIVRKIMK